MIGSLGAAIIHGLNSRESFLHRCLPVTTCSLLAPDFIVPRVLAVKLREASVMGMSEYGIPPLVVLNLVI